MMECHFICKNSRPQDAPWVLREGSFSRLERICCSALDSVSFHTFKGIFSDAFLEDGLARGVNQGASFDGIV